MRHDPAVESVVQQYMDAVAKSLGGAPSARRKALLGELREHIREAMAARTSGRPATVQDAYATLAEMDAPEAYADTPTTPGEARKLPPKMMALALVCVAAQVLSLVLLVAGVPVIGAVGGFAAVVMFFLVWSCACVPPWVVKLCGVAAACGIFTIILEIARAL